MKPFLWFLLFRLLNLALVRTWFVPDEVFQSVEVAHKVVFETGHLSWEWDRNNALRSIMHPALFIAPFWVLKRLGLDANWAVNAVPNVIHAVLFAVADLFMLKLAKTVHGVGRKEEVKTTMIVHLFNWFTIYCAPRTLSNSLETVLTLVALEWFPATRDQARYGAPFPFEPYIFLATLSIVIRPTSVAIWIPLGLWHLYNSEKKLRLLLRTVLPAVASPVLVGLALDSMYYGRYTFSALNFVRFNVLQGGSAHFGVHPWHWYITNGLPSVLTLSMMPLLVYCCKLMGVSARRTDEPGQKFFWVSVFYVFVHTLIAHKEHRFLLPILPLIAPYISQEVCRSRRWKSVWVSAIVAVNVALACYFGLVHQRGPIAATVQIRDEVTGIVNAHPAAVVEVLHLMPCYSLPQYTAFHGLPVRLRTLDCSPRLESSPSDSYVDEADAFHDNPDEWLVLHWKDVGNARVVVAYEKTFRKLEKFLTAQGFTERKPIFHSHFLTSERQDRHIIVAVKP